MNALLNVNVWTLCVFSVGSGNIFYNVDHIFREEMDRYFKNFDIVFGDPVPSSSDRKGYDRHREIAHYQMSFEDQNNATSRPAGFETSMHSRIILIINLHNLNSLQTVVLKVGQALSDESKKQEMVAKPYVIITWQNILSDKDEEQIKSNLTKFTDNLTIDTDVYFTFLKCGPSLKTNGSKPLEFNTTKPCPNNKSAQLEILELYSFKQTKVSRSLTSGKVETSSSLVQKVFRRGDFGGAELNTVAVYGYPLRAKFDRANKSFEGGYEADQIAFLGESFNLSIKVAVGKGWIALSNNSVTGIGKQVTSGEADISISASELLPYRSQYLQFLQPTYYTKIWGFFVQPPSSSFRDIFIHAFTGDLWLTMLSTWVLIILAMKALAIVKRRLDTMHENDTVLMEELVIWAAGAVCQQGWHICPESTCMKIIFIFALITGLVSYVAYSAALVSILSLKVVPIKTLEDIVSRGYKIYQDNQTINTMFIIKDLEEQGKIPCMALEQRSLRSEAALPKVLSTSDPSAFIGASDFFYPVAKDKMNDTQICNSISRILITRRLVHGGMFIRRGSTLKDFFNHRLLIMFERGIRFRLLETYLRSSAVLCLEKNSGATKDPLGFNDVYTAFVILILGYCLSLLVLVVERIFPPPYYHKQFTTTRGDSVQSFVVDDGE